MKSAPTFLLGMLVATIIFSCSDKPSNYVEYEIITIENAQDEKPIRVLITTEVKYKVVIETNYEL